MFKQTLASCIIAGVFSLSSAPAMAAKNTKPSNTIQISQQSRQLIKIAKKQLTSELRVSLRNRCYSTKPAIKPILDTHDLISLKERERRIVALELKLKRIDGYLELLKKAYKGKEYEQKVMEVGYIVSDGMMTLSTFFATKFFGSTPWLSIVLPVALKVTSRSLSSDTKNIVTPQKLSLQASKEMDRIVQLVQFKKNPGPYNGVICYLTAPKMANGKACRPDHPFIIQQAKVIGTLWQKSQKDLNSRYAWWLAPMVEFLTKHELKVIQNEKNFILISSGLLRTQKQFLKKMLEVLKNDYKAHGCKHLGPFLKS